jgi:hypothetical protein
MKTTDSVMRTYRVAAPKKIEGGPGSAGQSGDTQGLPNQEEGCESVKELLEEGQPFEAEALMGVEEALDPDESEVRTRQLPPHGEIMPAEIPGKD